MVSKASDDFPEPETPVTTVSALCGISKSMFLRLCTRAPRTTILSLGETDIFSKVQPFPERDCTAGLRNVAESFYYSVSWQGCVEVGRTTSLATGDCPCIQFPHHQASKRRQLSRPAKSNRYPVRNSGVQWLHQSPGDPRWVLSRS